MSYHELERHYGRLSHLAHASAILGWDEAVLMAVPSGASRAAALATLRGLAHEIATDPRIGNWLADAHAKHGELNDWQRANVREIERSWRRATCLPTELVERSTRTSTACEQAWRRLRPANDWASLRPLLEDVVACQRERAAALGEALGLSRYDALLDGYEPGVTGDEIDAVFAQLGAVLPDFTRDVLERQRSEPCTAPPGPFDRERQRRLGVRLMAAVGFDARRGRLDVSDHPFCGGVPQDVRITTRYDDTDFAKALMGVLHETGHALYEQGLPVSWAEQPVGRSRSMGIHESQSLLREMQVARSREFFEFAAPIIREELGVTGRDAFAVDNLYRCATRVAPGKIRVDADEVTYPSHILLRTEIERGLIEGRLEVRDLPELWDTRMRELLGIATAGDDRDGCMQDVHWAAGAFGYFPTYTLGALNAAQLFAAALRAHPEIPGEIATGRFETLNEWLRVHVWSRASSVGVRDLIADATGRPLDPGDFLAHLQRRYLG